MATRCKPCAKLSFALLPLVLCAAGCFGNGRVEIAGKVRLDGVPVERGAIRFLHGGNGAIATALIERGDYRTRMIPGPKRVEIDALKVVKRQLASNEPGAPIVNFTEQILPSEYNTQSKLKVEIIESNESLDFDLGSSIVKNVSR